MFHVKFPFISLTVRQFPPTKGLLLKRDINFTRKNEKISFNLEFIKTLTTVKLGAKHRYTENRQFVCKILPQLFPLCLKNN